MTITDPKDIRRFHMMTQLQALKLEEIGLKHSRGSVLAHVKRTYGWKGTRRSVMLRLQQLIDMG